MNYGEGECSLKFSQVVIPAATALYVGFLHKLVTSFGICYAAIGLSSDSPHIFTLYSSAAIFFYLAKP